MRDLLPSADVLQLLLRVFWLQQQPPIALQQQLAAKLLQHTASLVAEVETDAAC